ncbi:MAG: cell division protein FtsW [Flavobacteriia bacterium]|nr:cell division protein FtsW [Flavobacteriia bacterium]
MKTGFAFFQGDRVLWGIIALLAVFSFLPVYSSSTNLAYVVGKGTPMGYLIKHFFIMLFGFGFMLAIHRVPFHYFKGISILMLPVSIVLLLYTASQGTVIEGANASRWIRIPLIGLSFQTSTLASLTLLTYLANYLSKGKVQSATFKSTALYLWLPVLLVVLLIFPSNFSTAALLFFMSGVLIFISGYPIKYLAAILASGVGMGLLFVLLAKAFPNVVPNRIDTWINRIENFSQGDAASGNYQIERAKIAVATGGILGVGAGKSVMKNFLPQSSSDFIYAIIVEEWGIVGGTLLIVLYLLLLFRIVVIAHKAAHPFAKLLVMGIGIPIVLQAFVNIGVALQVFPVTGQTLPLISSGGTSAWMTCIALGMILSVSRSLDSTPASPIEMDENNPLAVLSETV